MSLVLRLSEEQDTAEPRLSEIVSLINRVYSEAEAGMWNDGFQRVKPSEVVQYISDKNLIFAFKDEKLVGSVFVTQLSKTLGEFGMLVCEPSHRHQGIGRRLIAAAEDRCRELGCSQMQLEILYPKDWSQPTKEILKVWYPALGYRKGAEENFNEMYPQLAPVLAAACAFSTYTKDLGESS
ncbi:GNAT family N-acetyltransferase [Oligoflexaceae bacterium]|nr:GNAT family N-acetyltransferase [Oligoflexaceae bacterium]